MQVASSHNAQEWLETPLGEALLQQEARVLEEALDGIFGEEHGASRGDTGSDWSMHAATYLR